MSQYTEGGFIVFQTGLDASNGFRNHDLTHTQKTFSAITGSALSSLQGVDLQGFPTCGHNPTEAQLHSLYIPKGVLNNPYPEPSQPNSLH